MPVAPPYDLHEYLAEFRRAARHAGFAEEGWGEAGGHPLLAFMKSAAGRGAPSYYLSAGMHGDEPAPPLALFTLLASGDFDADANWTICPVLNPTGLARGTRENAAGVDLNRDYKSPATPEIAAHVTWLRRQPRYDAVFCLHEDYEAAGFYLYELKPDKHPSAADAVLAAVAEHCPIEQAAVIDGRPADAPGIIRPVTDPLLRDQWPEAIYLRHHHTNLSYTFETPTGLTIAVRVAAHAAALRAALNFLRVPGRT